MFCLVIVGRSDESGEKLGEKGLDGSCGRKLGYRKENGRLGVNGVVWKKWSVSGEKIYKKHLVPVDR